MQRSNGRERPARDARVLREPIPWGRYLLLLALAVVGLVSFLLLKTGSSPLLVEILLRHKKDMENPPAIFGTYHFFSIGICLIVTTLTAVGAWHLKKLRRPGAAERLTDLVVFGFGLAFGVLELYKQFYVYFITGNGHYDFSIFPFQFCSLPIYVCLFAPLLTSRRWKHRFYCFLALFGTIGGCLVMAYPYFSPEWMLCLHTMIWHSLMIALGIFLLVAENVGASARRDYLPAAGMFLGSVALATVLNVALRPLTEQSPGVLNLFYMSPYYETYFVVISDVQRALGWLPALLTYVAAFLILGALPLYFLGKGLNRRKNRIRSRKPGK